MSRFKTDAVALTCILFGAAAGGAATFALMNAQDEARAGCAVAAVDDMCVAVNQRGGDEAVLLRVMRQGEVFGRAVGQRANPLNRAVCNGYRGVAVQAIGGVIPLHRRGGKAGKKSGAWHRRILDKVCA